MRPKSPFEAILASLNRCLEQLPYILERVDCILQRGSFSRMERLTFPHPRVYKPGPATVSKVLCK